MSRTTIEAEALRIWREREMRFPVFVRRMTPDALDRASGAWDRVVAEAAAQFARAEGRARTAKL